MHGVKIAVGIIINEGGRNFEIPQAARFERFSTSVSSIDTDTNFKLYIHRPLIHHDFSAIHSSVTFKSLGTDTIRNELNFHSGSYSSGQTSSRPMN
jgi:hypothetical protein